VVTNQRLYLDINAYPEPSDALQLPCWCVGNGRSLVASLADLPHAHIRHAHTTNTHSYSYIMEGCPLGIVPRRLLS
jgi:hypothetical protein